MVLSINQSVKFVNILPKTHLFEPSFTKSTYSIRPQNLNCSFKNVVHLFTCKTYHKQYAGSTEEFRSRFNNYRRSYRNFLRNKKAKQESSKAHAHFVEGFHQGESDWEVRLIDQGVSVDDDVRWRESYLQHELDTFQPNELNDREVVFFNSTLFNISLFILFSDKPTLPIPI